jgi:(p)ppGpp synthase/HD superfamily hydrolase
MTTQEKINWIISQHKNTNHTYDGLPYEFHLKMVAKYASKFKYLLPEGMFVDYNELYHNKLDEVDVTLETILLASWGHDLIEDTRVTYNDVRKQLGEQVADIIYALTNEKGKNRKERANEKYYEGIRNTRGAVYVKMCDRLANVAYSKLFETRMLDCYREENNNFVKHLFKDPIYAAYEDMLNELNNLLKK